MPTTTLKEVRKAEIIPEPDFAKRPGKRNGAIVKGLAYEKKVVKDLTRIYGEEAEVICHPWISYEAKNKKGVCQPDAFLIPKDDKKPIILIEVKLSWTTAARKKMTAVYEKVLKHMYPDREIKKVQVCKYLNKRCKDTEFVKLRELLDVRLRAYSCVHWV